MIHSKVKKISSARKQVCFDFNDKHKIDVCISHFNGSDVFVVTAVELFLASVLFLTTTEPNDPFHADDPFKSDPFHKSVSFADPFAGDPFEVSQQTK